MNNLDKTYQDLLKDILENGTRKGDRTGTGTISVFGRQIRHKMSDGFPLLTTKKMYMKGIITELIWFLRGDTNIKFLVDNDCHIWDGDAYQSYCKRYWELGEIAKIEYGSSYYNHETNEYEFETYSKEEFVNYIKTNDAFAKKWGELGPIYGKQWRNWGGWKDVKQRGFLHKTDNGWAVKWSDLHSFANGTEWLITPIQDSDQSLYSDEDEGKKVYYKNITLGYNEKSFCPIQVAKVIDDKFDKYVGGIDQIQNLINDIKTNPDSRRLMVNAWNVGELDSMTLPPCHYGFQVYTRELSQEERWRIRYNYHPKDKQFPWDRMALPSHDFLDKFNIPRRAISLMWNQRSVDTFLGLPFNIASYGLLLEIVGKMVNMVPDELIGNLGDVHLYSNHVDQALEQIGRYLEVDERVCMCYENPSLDLTKIQEGMSDSEFTKVCDEFGIPTRTREPFDLPKLGFNKSSGFFRELGDDLSLLNHLDISDFMVENYQSHSTIKAQLSN
jgi:thymidylate synthase